MVFSRGVLALLASVYGGFGAYALVAPKTLAELIGIGPLGASGRIEVRAVYGGLELGLAGLLAASAASKTKVLTGLYLGLASVGGLALARALALLAEAERPRVQLLSLAVEAVMLVLVLLALRSVNPFRSGDRR